MQESSLPGDYGLVLRAPSSEEVLKSRLQADIIFVHGINGDPARTWVHEDKDGKVDWTSDHDFLPTRFPLARIFTFKWNARVLHYNSDANIKHIASSLLSEIAKQRKTDEEKYRKLIFICHSLGGLIVQRALSLPVDAAVGEDRRLLQESTVGTIFLSTPHGGSELAKVARRLLWFADSPVSLLKLLCTDSTSLSKVTQRFKNYVLERRWQPSRLPLDIVSFGELKRTRVMGFLHLMIVRIDRSKLGITGEIHEPVNKDHRSIARFKFPNDPVLRSIVHHLKSFINKPGLTTPAPPLETSSQVYEFPSGIERFLGQNIYIEKICNFLLGATENKHLAVWGQRGMGKTELVRHYADHHRHEYDVVKWFDVLGGEQSLRLQLEQFYDSLSSGQDPILKNMPINNQNARCNTVIKWLEKQRRCLIVYDNVDIHDVSYLPSYFPKHRPVHRVVIGPSADICNALANSDFEVRQMSCEDAVTTFQEIAGLDDTNTPETWELTRQIVVDELGRTPFYIALAAQNFRRAQYRSLSAFLERLQSQKDDPRLKNSQLVAGDGSAIWSMVYDEVKGNHDSFTLLKLFTFLDGFGIRSNLLERFWSTRLRWNEAGEESTRTAEQDGIDPQLYSLLSSVEAFESALQPLLDATFIHRTRIGPEGVSSIQQIEMQPLVQQYVLRMMTKQEQLEWTKTAIRLVSHAVFEDTSLELRNVQGLWKSLIPHVLKCHKMSKTYAIHGFHDLQDIHEPLAFMLLCSVSSDLSQDDRGLLDLVDSLLRYRSTVAERCKAAKWRAYFLYMRDGRRLEAEKLLANKQDKEQALVTASPSLRTPRSNAAMADVIFHRAQCLFVQGNYSLAKKVLESWTAVSGPSRRSSRLELQCKRIIDTAVNKTLILLGPENYAEARRGLEEILDKAGLDRSPFELDEFNWLIVTLAQLCCKMKEYSYSIELVTQRLMQLKKHRRIFESITGDLRIIHCEALLKLERYDEFTQHIATLKHDLESPEQRGNSRRSPQLYMTKRLRARAFYYQKMWVAAKDAWMDVLEHLEIEENHLDPKNSAARSLPRDYETAEAIFSLGVAYGSLGDKPRAMKYQELATKNSHFEQHPSDEIDYSEWLSFMELQFAALVQNLDGRISLGGVESRMEGRISSEYQAQKRSVKES